jgi:hypothetical protein
MTESKDTTHTVRVGYHGQRVPMRFNGEQIFVSTNKTEYGRNHKEYHTWTLYRTHKGFRVLDVHTNDVWGDGAFPTENVQLSQEMVGGFIAYHYPKVVHDAIEKGILTEEECVLSAKTRDQLDAKRDFEKDRELEEEMEQAGWL